MPGQVDMVYPVPYFRENDHGGLVTICEGKWVWCVRHHPLGQVAMVHWAPYSGENEFGGLVTM